MPSDTLLTFRPAPLAGCQEWGFGFREPSSSSTGGTSSEGSGSMPFTRLPGNDTFGRPHQTGGSPTGNVTTAVALSDPRVIAQLSSLLPLRGTAEQQRWQVRWARRLRGRPCHPDDWQWALAERALRAMRPSITAAALVAFAATLAVCWHRVAFP